jgi:hypothetical protein
MKKYMIQDIVKENGEPSKIIIYYSSSGEEITRESYYEGKIILPGFVNGNN